MPGGIGPLEMLIVLAIVLVLFGAKKLPELARGLGKSVTNFKSGLNEAVDDETEVATQAEKEAQQKDEIG